MDYRLSSTLTAKITLNDALRFMFWLFFFAPPCVERISGFFDTASDLLCYASFALFFLLNFKGKYYVDRFRTVLLIFLLWCTICVTASSLPLLPHFILKMLVPVILVLVVVDLSVKRDGIKGIKPLYYVCCLYVILNFASMILFPNGMFQSDVGSSILRAQWVLGSKNNIPRFEIIFLTVIMAYEFFESGRAEKRKDLSWIYIVMAAYAILFGGETSTGFLEGSSTGIVAIVVCVAAFIYLTRFKSLPRVFTVGNTIIGAAAANIFLLGGSTLPIVTKIIVGLFNKSITFSGRTTIWQTNLVQIKNSPIFGFGLNTFDAPVYTAGKLTTTTYTYNMFLKYMISYGVVSIILIVIALLCLKKTNATLTQILNVGMIGIIIIGTMNEMAICDLMMFPILISAIGKTAQFNEAEDERKLSETSIYQ